MSEPRVCPRCFMKGKSILMMKRGTVLLDGDKVAAYACPVCQFRTIHQAKKTDLEMLRDAIEDALEERSNEFLSKGEQA